MAGLVEVNKRNVRFLGQGEEMHEAYDVKNDEAMKIRSKTGAGVR